MRVAAEFRKEMDRARDLGELTRIVRRAARKVTGAPGATFVLREDSNCFYADEDAIAPLWKGQRFPLTACISGWSMLHDETAIVSDIETDDRIPLESYRITFVRSLVMVPVGSPEPVAAIGAYWSLARKATAGEVAGLEQLARLTATAIDRIGLDNAPWAPAFDQFPDDPRHLAAIDSLASDPGSGDLH
jgi:GAF domain-containing protein